MCGAEGLSTPCFRAAAIHKHFLQRKAWHKEISITQQARKELVNAMSYVSAHILRILCVLWWYRDGGNGDGGSDDVGDDDGDSGSYDAAYGGGGGSDDGDDYGGRRGGNDGGNCGEGGDEEETCTSYSIGRLHSSSVRVVLFEVKAKPWGRQSRYSYLQLKDWDSEDVQASILFHFA